MSIDKRSLAPDKVLKLRDQAISDTRISVIIVDALQPDLPIVDVNPAFELLTGYSAEEILGQNCRILQGVQTDPDVVAAMRDAISAGKEISVTVVNYRKDGTPFWNDVHITPTFNEEGQLTHFVGVQSDVTQRRRAEENRDLLVDASAILAGSSHPDDAVARIAERCVPAVADICLGFLNNDPGGLAMDNQPTLVACEQSPIASDKTDGQLVAELISTNDGVHGVRWVLQSGETVWIPGLTEPRLRDLAPPGVAFDLLRKLAGYSMVITPIASPSRIYGALVFLRSDSGHPFRKVDIDLVSDLGRRAGTVLDNLSLFEQTQSALQARDTFLSVAAHELRTPVASIKGYAQFLLRSIERKTLSLERLQHAMSTIDASAIRLSTLTDDLLSVSRRNLDHIPLRREQIDIGDYLETFFSESGPAAQKGYHTSINFDHARVFVDVDVERLHQVLTILLSNASKFSPEDDLISIAAESDTDGVTITVSDMGIGLLPGEEKEIFEPFGRTEEAVKGQMSGLGIGLFIARAIVERHDGRIWAHSQGRGLGTSINVWLPILTFGEPIGDA